VKNNIEIMEKNINSGIKYRDSGKKNEIVEKKR